LIGVKLLTQQYTATSAVREEIDEDHFALTFCCSQGLVKGPVEPGLRTGGGDEQTQDGQNE